MIYLGDIVRFNENWTEILNSVLPGGENWIKFEGIKGCLKDCPSLKDCDEGGPGGLVCSIGWRAAEASPQILGVLRHVLQNFDYYDRNDCTVEEKDKEVGELLSQINHWDSLSLGPAYLKVIDELVHKA